MERLNPGHRIESKFQNKELVDYIKHNISSEETKWEREELFSANQLIDAFLIGKKSALTAQQRAIQDYFDKNKAIIDEFTEKLYSWLVSKGFDNHQIRLKLVNINDFEIMVIISDKDIRLEDYLGFYRFTNELINGIDKDNFNVTFSILQHTEELDTGLIVNDGFGLKYAPQKRIQA